MADDATLKESVRKQVKSDHPAAGITGVSSYDKEGNFIPGWTQAKEMLDSNPVLSLASYALPIIGTARGIDDWWTKRHDDNEANDNEAWLDLALAAAGIIPGIGSLAGVGKAAKIGAKAAKSGGKFGETLGGIFGKSGTLAGRTAGAADIAADGSLLGSRAAGARQFREAQRAFDTANDAATTAATNLTDAERALRIGENGALSGTAQDALAGAERQLLDEANQISRQATQTFGAPERTFANADEAAAYILDQDALRVAQESRAYRRPFEEARQAYDDLVTDAYRYDKVKATPDVAQAARPMTRYVAENATNAADTALIDRFLSLPGLRNTAAGQQATQRVARNANLPLDARLDETIGNALREAQRLDASTARELEEYMRMNPALTRSTQQTIRAYDEALAARDAARRTTEAARTARTNADATRDAARTALEDVSGFEGLDRLLGRDVDTIARRLHNLSVLSTMARPWLGVAAQAVSPRAYVNPYLPTTESGEWSPIY